MGTRAPNFLELSRRNIGTIVRSNTSPELLTASLVNSTELVSVDDLRLMSNLGVDAKSVVWLRRLAWGKRARFREKDFVLVAAGRGGNRRSPRMWAAASVAHRRAMARRLRIVIVVHCH